MMFLIVMMIRVKPNEKPTRGKGRDEGSKGPDHKNLVALFLRVWLFVVNLGWGTLKKRRKMDTCSCSVDA